MNPSPIHITLIRNEYKRVSQPAFLIHTLTYTHTHTHVYLFNCCSRLLSRISNDKNLLTPMTVIYTLYSIIYIIPTFYS